MQWQLYSTHRKVKGKIHHNVMTLCVTTPQRVFNPIMSNSDQTSSDSEQELNNSISLLISNGNKRKRGCSVTSIEKESGDVVLNSKDSNIKKGCFQLFLSTGKTPILTSTPVDGENGPYLIVKKENNYCRQVVAVTPVKLL